MATTVQRPNVEKFDLKETRERRLVFVNGAYSKEYSKVGELPAGVKVEALEQGRALSISAADKVVMEDVLHVLFFADKPKGPVSCRVLVNAGASTRLKVVAEAVSFTELPFEGAYSFDVRLEPNACVNFYQLCRGKNDTAVFTNHFHLKRHADLDYFSFTNGGAVTKNDNEVFFEEEHAFASLKGLAVLDGESQVVNRVKAHHKTSHGISRQFYKSILAGKAKSDFDSLVNVAKGTVKADSRQLSKNILLSDAAQAWARPQLLIEADDVACAHGATVGQLEKDELFYLRSRGISKEAARFLLTYGFAEEILEGLQLPALKKELEAFVGDELRRMVPKEA